jgi:type IX secretion system PorP/SprF family membrane protein
MRKQIFFFFFILLSSYSASAGNNDTLKTDTVKPVLSEPNHFLFNNIVLNPAYTGIFNGQNIIVRTEFSTPMVQTSDLYRPQQYMAAYDASLGEVGSNAIGFYFSDTKSGAFSNTVFGASYAHNFDLFPKSSFYNNINVGLSFSYNSVSIDLSHLSWGSQIDPTYGFIYSLPDGYPQNISKSYTDCILGFWYTNPYFYLGASARSLTHPDAGVLNSYNLPMMFDVACGGNIFHHHNFSLSPSINAKIIQGYKGRLNSYNPALLFTYRHKYIAGLSYKDLNKLTINAGYVFLDRFKLSASCGFFTNSDLYKFGSLGFIGAEIRYNIKSYKNNDDENQ